MKKILMFSGLLVVFVLITGASVFNENEPKPLKVYQKDGVVVNSYDYDGLKYFLKKDNDTTYVI
ncbi:MAG: hypothetical protein EOO46_18560, partial [Flavobacterium sp.]